MENRITHMQKPADVPSSPAFSKNKPHPEELMAGKIIASKYKLEEVIGLGGYGVVYRAAAIDGKPVALKLEIKETGNSDYMRGEVRILRKLTSERCKSSVGYIAQGEHDGRIFVVMDLLEGAPLSTAMEKGSIKTLREAKGILLAVCDALAEVSSFGVIHRDVKPSNIFLTDLPDGGHGVKILDFSISELVYGRRYDTPGIALGAPLYMAPEIIIGERATERSDVYSLGVIMYKLFTGLPPYEGEGAEIIEKCINRASWVPSSINRALPPEIDRLVAMAMAKKPNMRLGSFTALKDAIIASFDAIGEAVSHMLPPQQSMRTMATSSVPNLPVGSECHVEPLDIY